MIVACIRLWYAFGQLVLICEMAEEISSAFGEIEDEMNEMDWHLFSIRTQKKMLFTLMNAQQPVKFTGFGNLPANRETMKRVK